MASGSLGNSGIDFFVVMTRFGIIFIFEYKEWGILGRRLAYFRDGLVDKCRATECCACSCKRPKELFHNIHNKLKEEMMFFHREG